MPSFFKSLNFPNTLLLGSLSMMITHASAAGKPARGWSVIETAKDNAPGNMGKWENGERYARNIIGDFSNHVCGFIDWNIVLDQRGGPNHVGNFCDAPVIVDTNTKKVTYGPSFYYLAHFSKFVQPGARRIRSEGGPQGIQSIAFSNPDGTLAIVVVNPTEQAAGFTLGVAGESVACKIPARAIQTYLEAPH